MRKACVAIVALCGLSVVSSSSSAQSGEPGGPAAGMEKLQAAQLENVTLDREGFAARLANRWRDQLGDGGAELMGVLAKAPADRLLQASEAASLDEVKVALAGTGAIKNDFGDTTTDLVFTPVAPCRIIDTRSAVAGILTAGVVRTFGVNGNMSAQGGSTTGCGIPVDPLAVVVNLAAINGSGSPTGAGNVRAWRHNDPVPTAVVLNYNASNTTLSNMVVIPVCFSCGTLLDISLRSDVSNVHVVGDIVGYYAPPAPTALQCVTTAETIINVAAGAQANAPAPACATDYTETATYCESSTWQMPFVYFSGGTCSAQNNGTTTASLRASRRCCRIPGLVL